MQDLICRLIAFSWFPFFHISIFLILFQINSRYEQLTSQTLRPLGTVRTQEKCIDSLAINSVRWLHSCHASHSSAHHLLVGEMKLQAARIHLVGHLSEVLELWVAVTSGAVQAPAVPILSGRKTRSLTSIQRCLCSVVRRMSRLWTH